jgi:outer membrane receptor for ferrienterochelin and colicins
VTRYHQLLRRLSAGTLCVCLGASVAHAQSVSPKAEGAADALGELDLVKLLNVEVSTATKTSESIEEAPAVITVVTRDDIHRWGYQSVAEVLTHTAGFYLTDDHMLPNAGVRGMTGGLGAESGVIKLMIDGRSVAYRTTSGNWLGVELIPLESVQQIEVIRGPASALYGADAFLGVVNIITVRPGRARPLRARVTVGSTENNLGGTVDVVGSGQMGKWDFLLGAAAERSDRSGLVLPSESPAPTLPAGVGARRVARNLERRSLVLQGRLGYRDAELGHLEVSAYGSGLERGGDFAHWAQLTNYEDERGREFGTVVALGQFRVNADALVHATKTLDIALQSTYFQGGTLPADRIEVASDLFYVERRQRYQGVDSMLELRYAPDSRFNVIAGAETVYDRESFASPDRINRVTGEAVANQQATKLAELVNVGAYISTNYKLLDPHLKLTGGIRYDQNSEYGALLTGRMGLTSRLSRALVAKLLYGSAFKAPSPYLLHARPLRPGDVVGNEQLDAQRIHTLEYQMSFTPTRWFGVTSSVSQSWLLDKAEFTPQGINQTARNVASQRSLAWETRFDVRRFEDVNAYLSLDLLHSERELGQEGYAASLVGSRNVGYPNYIVRSGVAVGVPSLPDVPLELGAEGVFVGPRRAAETSIVERGESFDLPSYLLLNLSLRTRDLYLFPGHESRVALRAKNVLVSRGPDPGPAGFEYPLTPASLFIEVYHAY